MSSSPQDAGAIAASNLLGLHLPGGGAREFSRHELEHFLQLFQALPVAIYTTDAQGRIDFYNDAAAELWGRRPVLGAESWCGAWKLYRLDGTAMAHDQCPMAVTIRTAMPVRDMAVIAERPDGARYSFISYPTPLKDADGRLTGAVNMQVDISERHRHEDVGARLAAIVESSDDAIISKDLTSTITSWNKGARALFGYEAAEIVGKSVLTLIPDGQHNEEPLILERIRRGEKIEHYETVRLHKDGSLLDVSLTVSPLKNAQGRIVGASKIARDITQRKRAEARLREQAQKLETLNQISKSISQDLDLERTVQAVTDAATKVIGANFGAFFYNVIDDAGESYKLHTLSGGPRAGFEKFGMPRDTAMFDPTFRGAGIVRSDDIRADPRYGKSGPPFGLPEGQPPVVSFMGVPVMGRDGAVVGGLFFGHDQPGIFQQDAQDIVVGIASHAAIAIDNAQLHQAAQDEIAQRRRAEDAKALLLAEIQHRVKNTLGVVQAIASQTFRSASKEERRSFLSRIQALAGAHDILTRQNWEQASVADMVAHALAPFKAPFKESNRIDVQGGYAALNANKALLLAMVLHELGTNAVKYGALSNDKGRVQVAWQTAPDEQGEKLSVQWREQGGPPVTVPEHKGFGSVLIERALQGERGRAQLAYHPDGVFCLLEIGL